VRLCIPSNASIERQKLIQVYGADVVLTDPLEGSDGAIQTAQRLAEEAGDEVYYADQYSNDANWRAHYETTGVELLEQTDGRITHFVAGLGTTGTMTGVGRRLKEERPDVELIAVQPDSPLHGLEGLKHLETALVPGIYDACVPDRQVGVSTEDAYRMVFRLAREEGLFVGPSAGAAVHAALGAAEGIEEGVVVALLPDGGERYLGDALLEEGR
jgi:cysteine synthase B